MKIAKKADGYEVTYRGHTLTHPEWSSELEAASDALSALVGLPVKIERSDAGGWGVSVHRLRWECPDCRLVYVADNAVTLADAMHHAAAAQHKHGTGDAEPPKRAGLLWAPQTRLPTAHKLGGTAP